MNTSLIITATPSSTLRAAMVNGFIFDFTLTKYAVTNGAVVPEDAKEREVMRMATMCEVDSNSQVIDGDFRSDLLRKNGDKYNFFHTGKWWEEVISPADSKEIMALTRKVRAEDEEIILIADALKSSKLTEEAVLEILPRFAALVESRTHAVFSDMLAANAIAEVA